MVAFHFNLYVTPTFNSDTLDFLNTRQIGDSIFKWNHDGFFHLFWGCTAVGDTNSYFIRIKVWEHLDRQTIDDAISPHEDDKNHQEISGHAIAGEPCDH